MKGGSQSEAESSTTENGSPRAGDDARPSPVTPSLDETVFDDISEGLYTTDRDGRVVSMTAAAEKILGWTLEELRGRRMHDVIHHKRRDGTAHPIAECAAHNVLVSGEPVVDFEDVFVNRDGDFIDVRYTSSPLLEGSDGPGLVVVFRDAGEGVLARADQKFLFAVANKIRVARDPAELLAEISDLIGLHLRLHRCLFNEIDLDTDVETVHNDFARDGESVAGLHRVSDYSPATSASMKAGITVVNDDSMTDPRTAALYAKVYGPSGERSYVAVPMLRDGIWSGSLWCSDDRPRHWTGREISLLETIAERVWSAVERLRTEKRLRASEELFSKAFRASPFALSITSLETGQLLEVNETFCRVSGYSRDEAIGKTTAELGLWANPPDREAELDLIRGLGELNEVEYLFRTRGGGEIVGLLSAERVEIGGVPCALTIIQDITHRKEAARQLKESEERFRMAQSAGNVGVWDWNIATGITYWSDTMWSFYGETPRPINPDDAFWSAHLHPDDRDRVKARLYEAVASDAVQYRDEFRILPPGESTVWIESIASITRRPDGTAVRMYGVNLDITERRSTEERVRRNETQLRLVTDSLPALIAYIGRDLRYHFVNGRYSEWFGTEAAELVGKPIEEVLGGPAFRSVEPMIAKVLNGERVSLHAEIPYAGVGTRFVHINYVPDQAADGSVVGFFSLVSDLTDAKRSEELLHSSEQRIALLMENVSDYAILAADTDGIIESWNTGAEKIFGYAAEEIIGKPVAVLFTAEDIARGVPANEMRLARQKGRASDERWHVRKNGSRFFASGVMLPLMVGKRLTGYAKIASDLTEKKRRAEELQKAHDELELRVFQRTRELADANENLRVEMEHRKQAEKQRVNLLHRIVSAQEGERRRIARDLHDQLGQRMTALRLKLASLRGVCGEDETIVPRVERLQEIAALLDSEVSFLASELRPSVLDDLGLEEALRAYAGEWSSHFDIEVKFHSNGLIGKRFDREAEIQLYRVAQEALNNVAKHSASTEVSILMEQTAQSLVLVIEDNGAGFEPDAAGRKRSKGLGLMGMKERAALVGAELEIESSPGSGATVLLRLPNRKKGRNNGRKA